MEEINVGTPNTNPATGRIEDLNSGPPNYKSSILTTWPRPQQPFPNTTFGWSLLSGNSGLKCVPYMGSSKTFEVNKAESRINNKLFCGHS